LTEWFLPLKRKLIMQTKLWLLDRKKDLDKQLQEAAELIKKGELVAFPTETVYGLGANGLNSEACRKIFAAKGRPADNPLILHIAKLEEIIPLSSNLSASAKRMMEVFWPGPLTMIVHKSDLIPQVVTAGLDTVAIRFPSNPVANRLIALSACPIAAPSANKSGKPSPTTAGDVLADMEGIIAGVIDGGACDIGVESTIVDTTVPVPTILRPGGITLEMLEEALGAVEIDPGLIKKDQIPKAPGMKYRHYAPQAEMYLVEGPEAPEQIKKFVELAVGKGLRIGVLADKKTIDLLPDNANIVSHNWGSTKAELAEKLYIYLRRFDSEKVDLIVGEGTTEADLGLAIMNRMRKSAGHNILWAEKGKLIKQSGKTPDFLPENMLK